MRHVFAILALTAFVGPALACDNSSELPRAEREFRSKYKGESYPTQPTRTEPYSVTTLGIAGGAMLVGAAIVTVRRHRR